MLVIQFQESPPSEAPPAPAGNASSTQTDEEFVVVVPLPLVEPEVELVEVVEPPVVVEPLPDEFVGVFPPPLDEFVLTKFPVVGQNVPSLALV